MTTESILLVTMGGQPQVVTFALDWLLAHGEIIREVVVLHLSLLPDLPTRFGQSGALCQRSDTRIARCPPRLGVGGNGEDDTMTTMVALVGEQPIPNLLPARSLKPKASVLVCTKSTERIAQRLQQVLSGIEVQLLKIEDAYNIVVIRDVTQEKVQKVIDDRGGLCFKLTGGTKTMVLAAYELARQSHSPFLYFQTEGPHGHDQQSVLYRYAWDGDVARLDRRIELKESLINLDDYLRVHFDGYTKANFSRERGGILERAVYDAPQSYVDEIEARVLPSGMKGRVEIDLVIRCGNQVGFIEVRGGGGESGKHAIDQLTTAAVRELLGIYAARFLVTGVTRDEQYKAVATAPNIMVIELSDWRSDCKSLSQRDAARLRQAIAQRLPCRKRAA